MGMDVELWVEAEGVTGEQVAAAEEFIADRCILQDEIASDEVLTENDNDRRGGVWAWPNHVTVPGRHRFLRMVNNDDPVRVEFYTLSRYWSPGYERGHWPEIFGAIRCMQAAFPGRTVHYGSDSSDPEHHEPVTEQMLAEYWSHFLGPEGNSYRDQAREQNRQSQLRAGAAARVNGQPREVPQWSGAPSAWFEGWDAADADLGSEG